MNKEKAAREIELKVRIYAKSPRLSQLTISEKVYLILNYHFAEEIEKFRREYKLNKHSVHYYFQDAIHDREMNIKLLEA